MRSAGGFFAFTISITITGSDARTRCFESRPKDIEERIGILDRG